VEGLNDGRKYLNIGRKDSNVRRKVSSSIYSAIMTPTYDP